MRARVTIQLRQPVTVPAHKPLCQKRTILSLPLPRQTEEVACDFATATPGPAPAWPCCAIHDVDVVVAGDLLASRDLTSRHKMGGVSLILLPSIGITTVIHVSIWEAEQDDLPIWVRAVVDSLAEIFAKRGLRGYLPNDVDTPYALAGAKRACREDPEAFDPRRPHFHVSQTSPSPRLQVHPTPRTGCEASASTVSRFGE
jgi:hypothetical protein